jgi:hypothetical protein
MTNNKGFKKNRVFGISDNMDELLKLYSSRKGVSLSELIRICIKEKMEKLQREEQKFWREMSADKIDEVLVSLTDYLNSKLSGGEQQTCEHSSIWENNYDENFTHTKEFCKSLQIELNAFLKRIESNFQTTFDCECELYETLMGRSNDNEK